jgi:hypothetical protein
MFSARLITKAYARDITEGGQQAARSFGKNESK